MIINDEDKIEMIDTSKMNIRSQDLDPSYHDAGQFYVFNVNVISSSIINYGQIIQDVWL